MANKSTLAVKVDDGLHKSIKKDAKKFRMKIETITKIMAKRFMGLPESVRAKEYEKEPKKIFGRPVV